MLQQPDSQAERHFAGWDHPAVCQCLAKVLVTFHRKRSLHFQTTKYTITFQMRVSSTSLLPLSSTGLQLRTSGCFWKWSALSWSSGSECRDLARVLGGLQLPDASPQAWSACSSTTEWLGRDPRELDLRRGRVGRVCMPLTVSGTHVAQCAELPLSSAVLVVLSCKACRHRGGGRVRLAAA